MDSIKIYNNSKLTKQQKKYLVSGYTHKTSKNQQLSVPTDIIKLCTQFYDDVTYWRVSSNYMKQFFYESSTGSGVIGPTFKTEKNIDYQLVIYPQGSQPNYAGYCECFFRIKTKNFTKYNIDELSVYFELGCLETNTEYRNIGKFTIEDSWSNWYPFNMKSSELQHFDVLTFNVYVDILQIKYNKSTTMTTMKAEEIEYNKAMVMNRRSKYEWNISGKLLGQLTFYEDNKRFYSPQYFEDNCWCLYCTPNTRKLYFHLYLRLIRLPSKVKTVKITCHLQSNTEPKQNTLLVSKFNYDHNSMTLLTLKPSQLLSLKELKLSLIIEIREVYDYDDHRVMRRHWNEYGIHSSRLDFTDSSYTFVQWKNMIKYGSKKCCVD